MGRIKDTKNSGFTLRTRDLPRMVAGKRSLSGRDSSGEEAAKDPTSLTSRAKGMNMRLGEAFD